jgi:hypothetical protein
MADQQRLVLPGERETDLSWMRAEIKELKLSDISDRHLEKFLDLAEGDRKLAVETIASIHAGKTYEPMRDLVTRRRGGT